MGSPAAGFLTINELDVWVTDENPVETIVQIGDRSRAFSGNLRSTVRAEKRVFGFNSSFMTEDEIAALKTETALGVTCDISGTALNDAEIQGKVTIEEITYWRDGTSHMRQVRILIEQV